MATHDWNHNGKDDGFDHYIDYELYGGDSDSSGRRRPYGRMTGIGKFLCIMSGWVEESVLFTVLDLEVEKLPVFVVLFLWVFGSCVTTFLVKCAKK